MTYCGRGICAAMDGHAGTCAEASGWGDAFRWHVIGIVPGEWWALGPDSNKPFDTWREAFDYADRMARGER